MTKKNYDCGVDAGCICFIPMELAEKWHYESSPDLVHEIKACGEFEYNIVIPNSWNGKIYVGGKIATKKGFLLGDLCYVICDDWGEVCDSMDNMPAGICISTGGDGGFEVSLELKEVKDE